MHVGVANICRALVCRGVDWPGAAYRPCMLTAASSPRHERVTGWRLGTVQSFQHFAPVEACSSSFQTDGAKRVIVRSSFVSRLKAFKSETSYFIALVNSGRPLNLYFQMFISCELQDGGWCCMMRLGLFCCSISTFIRRSTLHSRYAYVEHRRFCHSHFMAVFHHMPRHLYSLMPLSISPSLSSLDRVNLQLAFPIMPASLDVAKCYLLRVPLHRFPQMTS